MKKYQLKWNDGTDLLLLKQSDRLYDILVYIKIRVDDLKACSIWMDGQVLD